MTMTDSPALDGHLDHPVAELAGGDAGDGAPEVPAAAAAGGPVAGLFASFGAGFGEVEVLDDDGAGAAGLRGGDQGADRGARTVCRRGWPAGSPARPRAMVAGTPTTLPSPPR